MLFIVLFVPESIQPKKEKEETLDATSPTSPHISHEAFSWQSVDPFMSLRIIAKDATVMQLAMVVFLSNLPEAGQFSCFFVYLKLVRFLESCYAGIYLRRVFLGRWILTRSCCRIHRFCWSLFSCCPNRSPSFNQSSLGRQILYYIWSVCPIRTTHMVWTWHTNLDDVGGWNFCRLIILKLSSN